jgi:ABC-type multidrug transport system fused ATPase/permease subunit
MQQQRLGLVRVFLIDQQVNILNEPSSAFDVFTEQKLFDTLYKNVHNKLLILIAHRLSTIRAVDRIFLFKDGHVVELGSFAELLQKCDLLANMINLSSGLPA